MSDFKAPLGFEDAWRQMARPLRRRPLAVLPSGRSASHGGVRARLARIVNGAPEVMVKLTGRTRNPGQLHGHLSYISRRGEVELEDRDGALLVGREAVKELAEDWGAIGVIDSRRRVDTPFSRSLVLSMPQETDPAAVIDAARSFARQTFAKHFDYVFALHADTPHPHVHLAVRALGDQGERLHPSKADLGAWREVFAQTLRDRGIEAEASPRQARGVTLKAERMALLRLRERHEAGEGELPTVLRAAYDEAVLAAFGGEAALRPWEARMFEHRTMVRDFYLTYAQELRQSADHADRALAEQLETFVRSMRQPESRRLMIARSLLEARERVKAIDAPERTRDRGRDR